jgi:hypothetical protein
VFFSVPVPFSEHCIAPLLSYKQSSSLSSAIKRKVEYEEDSMNKQGNAAASLLLQLEFVYEVLENKLFHKQLIPLIDTENGSEILQSYFLELSEQILQLLALSSRVGSHDNKKYLTVKLGDVSINITMESLGSTVGNWCLEILKSMQKVLDAPAFVAILQELLDHEDASVRQTALQILGQRLTAMSQGKRPGAEERALFLDLTSHLREAVRSSLPALSPSQNHEEEIEHDSLGTYIYKYKYVYIYIYIYIYI